MNDAFDYDVYLAYARADKAAVLELALRLKADGLRVWVDEWVIQPGDSIVNAIEEGLESSRTLVLVMSRAAFHSEWVTLERHTALFRDPTNQHRRFIPLRLDECDIKDVLKQYAYIDWRDKDDTQYNALLAAVSRAPLDRSENGTLWTATQSNIFAGAFGNGNETFVVDGGRPLTGAVVVRGAKNTMPKQLVAAMLTSEPCILRNVAKIRDVLVVSEMIRSLGGTVEFVSDDVLKVTTDGFSRNNVANLMQFGGRSRIPILFCAPLIHRFGFAVTPALGGCELNGKKGRPIDFHIAALSKMGAQFKKNADESVEASCTRLNGQSVRLEFPSVGATEQVLLAASLARGTTYLSNASLEPEVIDLISVLQQMGANIHWERSRDITVQGVPCLGGFDHTAMADRSEIGSWACAAAATNGSVSVRNATPDGIEPLLDRFEAMGGQVDIEAGAIRFSRSGERLRAIEIETGPHPQFRTDWQPAFVTALTQAEGDSFVHETVFADRLGYVAPLKRMGAQIDIRDHCVGNTICRYAESRANHTAIVRGPAKLKATDLTIADLRGGFACLLAALVAEGKSVVRNVSWLHKGYEAVASKLKSLGASISVESRTEGLARESSMIRSPNARK